MTEIHTFFYLLNLIAIKKGFLLDIKGIIELKEIIAFKSSRGLAVIKKKIRVRNKKKWPKKVVFEGMYKKNENFI